MRYPKLRTSQASREMLQEFRGYNRNLRINEAEFYDMQNMSSDLYPVLSPRVPRGLHISANNPTGMIAKDALCYTDGTDFVINEYHVDMGLSDEPKQLVSMGAYVIIMPDKKYINTMDLTEYGDIEASFESSGAVSFELCTVDGAAYDISAVSDTEPAEPENLQYWIDTSSVPHTLKQYSAASAVWVNIATTYIKISATGIGKGFEQYDGVTIDGIKIGSLADLNSTMVVWNKGDDYIVVIGILDAVTTQPEEAGKISVKRQMPSMDYLTESGNRLWGCRYGVANNGDVVNEIYACKLGDFKNWNCFMGLSTDSYAASCGTDGPFTGATTLTYPIFFKENCLHKVYGNIPANFQVQTTECRGVQKGCHNSLAIVNETLYYKAKNGVMAYDGSLPQEASYALGKELYFDAVAGAHGNKYYISMRDTMDYWHLFVLDTAKSMWHREDDLQVKAFCSCAGDMYAISGSNILSLLHGDRSEGLVSWMAETGDLGLSSPDMKYVSRLTVRMSIDEDAGVSIYIQYDLDGEWLPVCYLPGSELRSFSLPIRPRRCDHLKLKFEGDGGARIYSITKTIEQGSDLS